MAALRGEENTVDGSKVDRGSGRGYEGWGSANIVLLSSLCWLCISRLCIQQMNKS